MNQHPKKRPFFPSLLLVAFISHYVYYIDVFNGRYPRCSIHVAVALLLLTIGYFFGYFLGPATCRNNRLTSRQESRLDDKRMGRIALAFISVGILAHVVYYSMHPLTGYAASYGSGKGNGYITIFFNFWPLGLLLNEYLISKGVSSNKQRVSNRVLALLYVILYFFYLMKRRQVLLLFLGIMAIWGPKMRKRTKVTAYVLGTVLLIVFTVFGKVRGYYDANGLISTFGYVSDNFSIEMLSLDEMEGKYISRTLNDIVGYVSSNGCDYRLILGILFCMVPRGILGGIKPLAFPEWYTYHFYPEYYTVGTGFAGSMVAELYLLGGMILLAIGYYVIGFVTARMQKRACSSVTPTDDIVYAIYVYTLIVLPRYDLASIFTDIVFMYWPMAWAMRSCDSSLRNDSRDRKKPATHNQTFTTHDSYRDIGRF